MRTSSERQGPERLCQLRLDAAENAASHVLVLKRMARSAGKSCTARYPEHTQNARAPIIGRAKIDCDSVLWRVVLDNRPLQKRCDDDDVSGGNYARTRLAGIISPSVSEKNDSRDNFF